MNIRTVAAIFLMVSIVGIGIVSLLWHFFRRTEENILFDPSPIEVPFVQERHGVIEEPNVPEVVPPAAPVQPKEWSDVPFISQAPTGEWGKNEFQNGCEEASALMAHAWRTGKTYTNEAAKAELIAMARYEEKEIGQGIDTDARDTAAVLLEGYFEISDSRITYDFSLDDLLRATREGIIIVPTNGRALGNPNFTAPGPIEHMLVITGYDELKKEFITNDPGTRKGAGYRYPERTLFDAIREYPTGKHLPIVTLRKAMIVVPAAPTY